LSSPDLENFRMAVIVSLSDVIEQMEPTTDEATAYINRKTGELITLTHEEVALTETRKKPLKPLSGRKTSCPRRVRFWRRRTISLCRASSRFTNGPSWNALPSHTQMPL
jgi:hypothetical protein